MEKTDERSHIVVKGEVVNQPEKRNVGKGENKTKMVADLMLVAREVTIDGVQLAPAEVERRNRFKVPVWGGEAREAGEKYRSGTLVTVEGRYKNQSWTDQKSGEQRNEHIIQDASVQIDRESKRGVKTHLIGNVAWMPTLEETGSGKAFIRMKLDRVESPAGQEAPERVVVVGWENQADAMEKAFRQGDRVAVKGEVAVKHWKTREGEDRTTFEIHRPELELLALGRDTKDRPQVGLVLKPDQWASKERPSPEPTPKSPGLAGALAKLFGRNKAPEQERIR
jgi:single-stranded DNA-binding protein